MIKKIEINEECMTEASQPENSYPFDAESATEIARLIERNAFFKEVMGGLFPEQTDLHGIVRITDPRR